MIRLNDLDKTHQVIIKKLCSYVGADPEQIDYEEKDWYLQYEWTQEQEDDFIHWLASYFVSMGYGKNNSKKVAQMFNLNYGWKAKKCN